MMTRMLFNGITTRMLPLVVAATLFSVHASFAQPIFVQTATGDSVPIAHPEDAPEAWAFIQDSTYVYLGADPETRVPERLVTAAYSFDMLSDSTAMTSYEFTECRRNGQRLKLRTWKDQRIVNAPTHVLSFNNSTDTFTCRAGDTLSFYRELFWKNLVTGRQDTAAYYALDTLAFAVELVGHADSARVALLDSTGILANTATGPPRIHGTRPLMAAVTWTVPPALDGVRAFLRLRLYNRGGGGYWFTRSDHVTIGMSERLSDSAWQDFLHVYQPTAPKTSLDGLRELSSADAAPGAVFLGVTQSGADELAIDFDNDPEGGRTTVAIYDAMGRHLYSPYVTTGAHGRASASYHARGAGPYFVCLAHGERLVRVRKVIIR